ncbi:MAG: hypothetical protein FWC68_01585 [Oscillospiraceae bacterium]|nr:hypothetical protein [Oscillospiraceae bacterium]
MDNKRVEREELLEILKECTRINYGCLPDGEILEEITYDREKLIDLIIKGKYYIFVIDLTTAEEIVAEIGKEYEIPEEKLQENQTNAKYRLLLEVDLTRINFSDEKAKRIFLEDRIRRCEKSLQGIETWKNREKAQVIHEQVTGTLEKLKVALREMQQETEIDFELEIPTRSPDELKLFELLGRREDSLKELKDKRITLERERNQVNYNNTAGKQITAKKRFFRKRQSLSAEYDFAEAELLQKINQIDDLCRKDELAIERIRLELDRLSGDIGDNAYKDGLTSNKKAKEDNDNSFAKTNCELEIRKLEAAVRVCSIHKDKEKAQEYQGLLEIAKRELEYIQENPEPKEIFDSAKHGKKEINVNSNPFRTRMMDIESSQAQETERVSVEPGENNPGGR